MKKIITVGREFGSGGREIAKLVAEKLGISYYDKELITLAAKEGGYDPEVFEKVDERATNSFLYSLSMGNFVIDGGVNITRDLPLADKLHLAQTETIRKLAQRESCVIVGRCANYLLREEKGCVRVFIYGEKEQKIQRVQEIYHLSREKAESLMKKTDKARANYYAYYTGENWADMRNFDLAVNSSTLPFEAVAEMIVEFVQKKENTVK